MFRRGTGRSSVCVLTADPPCDGDRACQSQSALSLAQVTAGFWHLISMACQLKANVSTCPSLYIASPQILTGLSYCLFTEPKATSHLHLRDGARERLCGLSQQSTSRCLLCATARRGKGESGSERSPVYLLGNKRRAEERAVGGKVETMIKRFVAFCQAPAAAPLCFLLS